MKERVRSGRRARDQQRHVTESTRSATACDGEHQKERGTESMRESEKEERKNKKMRVHCSSFVNFLAFTIFVRENFWVINAKKKSIFSDLQSLIRML